MYFKNDVYVYFIMILFHLHYIEWKIEQDEPIRLIAEFYIIECIYILKLKSTCINV